MRIGEIARKGGVSVHTLRFYERRGLLPPVARGASNYRQFPPVTLERLKLIREAQHLGFTLAEIGEVLGLRMERATSCEALRMRTERKLLEVEGRLRRLQSMKRALRSLLRDCEPARPKTGCPAARSLQGNLTVRGA